MLVSFFKFAASVLNAGFGRVLRYAVSFGNCGSKSGFFFLVAVNYDGQCNVALVNWLPWRACHDAQSKTFFKGVYLFAPFSLRHSFKRYGKIRRQLRRKGFATAQIFRRNR